MHPEPQEPSPRLQGVQRLLGRVALVGAAPGDSDEVLAQKATLTIASLSSASLAVIWVGTYLALGLPISAAIPFGYQLVSIATLILFARSRDYRFFRVSQLVFMLALPFLLQWSLGGYVASSAVSLWALIAAFGALFFYRADQAIPWFVGFVALTALSGLLEPTLAQHPAAIPDPIRITFFVLNVTGVAVTAYLLLQYFVRAREAALQRSDRLLLNVLPRSIAERLKHGSGVIAESHAEVSVLFADVVDFTAFVERTDAARVVSVLDEIFSAFDQLAARHGLEKIKTIGDAYMVVAGVPEPRPDHAEAAAEMALDMQATTAELARSLGLDLSIRVGIDSGPVIAGVIGHSKFIYDVWGDVVNTASRMESHGLPGRIQVTVRTHGRLRDRYRFEDRGEVAVKGKGRLHAYLLVGRLEDA
jgi:adenylate cyclase